MLSREYAPIPLNVRTYPIQYLLVLDTFQNFFSKYPTNYNKLHNYEGPILSLHSTLLKFLPAPMPPPPSWKIYISNLKGRVKPVRNMGQFWETASCQM